MANPKEIANIFQTSNPLNQISNPITLRRSSDISVWLKIVRDSRKGWGLYSNQFILKSFDELECSVTSVSIFYYELEAIIYVRICCYFIGREYQISLMTW